MSTHADPSRRNAFILSGMQALGGANPALVVALSSLVGQKMASSPDLATLPVGIFNLGLAVGILPAAYLMRRLGRQGGYIIGALLGIGAGLLAAAGIYSLSFVMFCVGTLLAGLYASYVQSYRFAAADDASDTFRPKAISWVMAGGLLGAIIATQTIIHTQDIWPEHPFAAAFLAQAALAALVLPFAFGLRLAPGTRNQQEKIPYTGRPLREIASNSYFIIAVVAGVASYVLMNFLMTASPLAMVMHGHSLKESTLGIQWHILAMFGPSFFTGNLIKRFGKIPVTFAGVLLLGLASIVALLGMTVPHFWVSLILLGLGWNFGFIGATNMVVDCYRPEERGRVQALNDFIIFTCVALSSFTSGRVLAVYGWYGVNTWTLPISAVVMLALAWLYFKNKRQPYFAT
ncbi:MFS transporter [Alcaligenes faecalis]|jgi:MFS family permease|uniref:MFS transporter n=1 Tax=Alcaligenes faecalis TaxID=511 RepID=A0A2U2BPN8_ALCFA|nr:MFS transporter [Alcaligenes faecalis]KAA1284123.1 MFS transporter [Alcaligenes faecalis]MBQ0216195.1 MFS transporter [Alcaligenes faecalis]MBW4790348.1 MFS transporter [Alcaligenes faecalis subsp. faecalis]OSZ36862.1 MFS transporter [Alcaligenes faecalis]OSZ44100.1 MFS transporter [Alcaligenes faecalis]